MKGRLATVRRTADANLAANHGGDREASWRSPLAQVTESRESIGESGAAHQNWSRTPQCTRALGVRLLTLVRQTLERSFTNSHLAHSIRYCPPTPPHPTPTNPTAAEKNRRSAFSPALLRFSSLLLVVIISSRQVWNQRSVRTYFKKRPSSYR